MDDFHDLREGDEVARDVLGWIGQTGYEIGRVGRVTPRQIVARWPSGRETRHWRESGRATSAPRFPLVRVTDEVRESVELREIVSWLRGLAEASRREDLPLPLLRALRAVARDPGLLEAASGLPCEHSRNWEAYPGGNFPEGVHHPGETACFAECEACLLRARALRALAGDVPGGES